jgi:hypothetical protein
MIIRFDFECRFSKAERQLLIGTHLESSISSDCTSKEHQIRNKTKCSEDHMEILLILGHSQQGRLDSTVLLGIGFLLQLGHGREKNPHPVSNVQNLTCFSILRMH